jgi:hypothetical protein
MYCPVISVMSDLTEMPVLPILPVLTEMPHMSFLPHLPHLPRLPHLAAFVPARPAGTVASIIVEAEPLLEAELGSRTSRIQEQNYKNPSAELIISSSAHTLSE